MKTISTRPNTSAVICYQQVVEEGGKVSRHTNLGSGWLSGSRDDTPQDVNCSKGRVCFEVCRGIWLICVAESSIETIRICHEEQAEKDAVAVDQRSVSI